MCETRDMEHTQELKNALRENYRQVIFGEIIKPHPSIGQDGEDFWHAAALRLNKFSEFMSFCFVISLYYMNYILIPFIEDWE